MSAAGKPYQLPLDLPFRTAFGREAFAVSDCNAEALRAVDDWPDWPGNCLAIYGPAGSGKTHLAHVWKEVSSAILISSEALTQDRVPQLVEHKNVVLEDGEKLTDPAALFHLINLIRQEGGSLLLTGQQPPTRWPNDLADLSSRLAGLLSVRLAEPDDELFRRVMQKQFADRQIEVEDDVIDYLLVRVERSFDQVKAIVRNLDAAALAEKRPITVRFVAQVLNKGRGAP